MVSGAVLGAHLCTTARMLPHTVPAQSCQGLPVGQWGWAVLQEGMYMDPHAVGLGPQKHPGTQCPAVLCSPCLAPRCPLCCSVTAPPQQDGGEKTVTQFLGWHKKVLSSFLS